MAKVYFRVDNFSFILTESYDGYNNRLWFYFVALANVIAKIRKIVHKIIVADIYKRGYYL